MATPEPAGGAADASVVAPVGPEGMPADPFAEAPAGPDVGEPDEVPLTKEKARELVALLLVGILGLLVLAPVGLIGAHQATWDQLRDPVITGVTAVAGLVGAAVTYYYTSGKTK